MERSYIVKYVMYSMSAYVWILGPCQIRLTYEQLVIYTRENFVVFHKLLRPATAYVARISNI